VAIMRAIISGGNLQLNKYSKRGEGDVWAVITTVSSVVQKRFQWFVCVCV
jgi:hypothetical protein